MNLQDKVTIIIPTRNSAKFLCSALKSVVGDPAVHEILILDSSSVDATLDCVRQFKRIRVINCGDDTLADALNRGIPEIRTPYVARMDADDISVFNRFSAQLHFLVSGNYDLVGSDFSYIGKYSWYLNYLKRTHFEPNKPDISLIYKSSVVHPTWFMKTNLLRQIQYRDQLGEDYDFLVRAKISGAKLGINPDILLFYRLSKAQASKVKTEQMLHSSKLISNKYIDFFAEANGTRDMLMMKDILFKKIYISAKDLMCSFDIVCNASKGVFNESMLKEIFQRMLFRLAPSADSWRLVRYAARRFDGLFARDCLPLILKYQRI